MGYSQTNAGLRREVQALLKRLEAAEELAGALDYFVRIYDRCSKGRTGSPASSAVWADCEEKSVSALAAWRDAEEGD